MTRFQRLRLMSRRCGVPSACCGDRGVFSSASSPLGSVGLGIPGTVHFKGGITTWRLASAVAVLSIVEGSVGLIWVSVATQRCLFVAMVFCSLRAWLVWLAKESRLHVGHLPWRTLAMRRCGFLAGRGVLKECAKWIFDGTQEKRQFRIDTTIKSTGKLMFFPPTTVGAGYLFRQSKRLLRFSPQRDGAQRSEIVGFQACEGDSLHVKNRGSLRGVGWPSSLGFRGARNVRSGLRLYSSRGVRSDRYDDQVRGSEFL